jgi:hypothetical protein
MDASGACLQRRIWLATMGITKQPSWTVFCHRPFLVALYLFCRINTVRLVTRKVDTVNAP